MALGILMGFCDGIGKNWEKILVRVFFFFVVNCFGFGRVERAMGEIDRLWSGGSGCGERAVRWVAHCAQALTGALSSLLLRHPSLKILYFKTFY